MTEKELAERLRDIANNAADADVELRMLADELDPDKEPKPCPFCGARMLSSPDELRPDGVWEHPGGTCILQGMRITGDNILQWNRRTPARILGPRQVAVDIPPVEEWPDDVTWVAVDWVSENGYVQTLRELIHRADAERLENE